MSSVSHSVSSMPLSLPRPLPRFGLSLCTMGSSSESAISITSPSGSLSETTSKSTADPRSMRKRGSVAAARLARLGTLRPVEPALVNAPPFTASRREAFMAALTMCFSSSSTSLNCLTGTRGVLFLGNLRPLRGVISLSSSSSQSGSLSWESE